MFFFVKLRVLTRSTRTATLLRYTTLFRALERVEAWGVDRGIEAVASQLARVLDRGTVGMGLAERIAPGDAKIVSRIEGERRVHAGTRGLAELAVVEAVAKPAAIVAAVNSNLAEEVRGERARERNGLGEIGSGLDARLRLVLERGGVLGRAH